MISEKSSTLQTCHGALGLLNLNKFGSPLNFALCEHSFNPQPAARKRYLPPIKLRLGYQRGDSH